MLHFREKYDLKIYHARPPDQFPTKHVQTVFCRKPALERKDFILDSTYFHVWNNWSLIVYSYLDGN